MAKEADDGVSTQDDSTRLKALMDSATKQAGLADADARPAPAEDVTPEPAAKPDARVEPAGDVQPEVTPEPTAPKRSRAGIEALSKIQGWEHLSQEDISDDDFASEVAAAIEFNRQSQARIAQLEQQLAAKPNTALGDAPSAATAPAGQPASAEPVDPLKAPAYEPKWEQMAVYHPGLGQYIWRPGIVDEFAKHHAVPNPEILKKLEAYHQWRDSTLPKLPELMEERFAKQRESEREALKKEMAEERRREAATNELDRWCYSHKRELYQLDAQGNPRRGPNGAELLNAFGKEFQRHVIELTGENPNVERMLSVVFPRAYYLTQCQMADADVAREHAQAEAKAKAKKEKEAAAAAAQKQDDEDDEEETPKPSASERNKANKKNFIQRKLENDRKGGADADDDEQRPAIATGKKNRNAERNRVLELMENATNGRK